MLNSIPRKLTPLVPIFTLIFSLACGKKLGESSDSPPQRTVENQEPNTLLILPLQSHYFTYGFEKFGSLNTPSELVVKEGSTTGKTVSAFYNLDRNGVWSIKCHYRGTASGEKMNLSGCVNYKGESLGNVSELLSMSIYIYASHFIQLQNPSGDLKVEAIYQVDW